MTTPRRRPARRAAPEPVRTNDLPIVLTGTAAWAAGMVATFLLSDALTDPRWARWFWVCAAGVLLGAVGLRRLRREPATKINSQVSGPGPG